MPESSQRHRLRSQRSKTKEPINPFELASLIGFTLVCMVAPWVIGAVQQQMQFYIWLLLMTTAMIWWTGVAVGSVRRIKFSLTMLPLLFAIGLGVFQLVPLPTEVAKILAPTQMKHRAEFGKRVQDESVVQPQEESSIQDDGFSSLIHSIRNDTRISINPSGTRTHLGMLVLAAFVFFLASQLFEHRIYFLIFAACMAVNGVVLSAVGIVHALSSESKLLWLVERNPRWHTLRLVY